MFGDLNENGNMYLFGAIISAISVLLTKSFNILLEAWKTRFASDTELKVKELDDNAQIRIELWSEYNRLKQDFFDAVERYRKMQESFLQVTKSLEHVQEQYKQVLEEKNELEGIYGDLLKRYEKAMKEIETYRKQNPQHN